MAPTEASEAVRVGLGDADSWIQGGRPLMGLVVLEKLEQSGLPDTDRAFVWVSIAVVRASLKARAATMAAYDRAIELEQPLGRHYAMVCKAMYLAEGPEGREQSASIFRELLTRQDLSQEERGVFTQNLRILESGAPVAVEPVAGSTSGPSAHR